MKNRVLQITAAAAALTLAAASANAAILAYWNFNAPGTAVPKYVSPLSADEGTGTLSWNFTSATDGVESFGGSALNVTGTSTTDAGSAIAIEGNGTVPENNGKYFELMVSTVGQSNIAVSFDQRGTSTGFATHTIEYTIDGSNWVSYGTTPYTPDTTGTFGTKTIDFTSITTVNNNANFGVRLTLDGASTSSGNNRFDNLKVEGGAVVTPTPSPSPTPVPPAITVDFSIPLPASRVATLTTQATTELDGVAVSPDGNTIYTFDSLSGVDSLLKYTVSTDTLVVYATTAQIAAAGGGSGASCDDLVVDSTGVVYGIFRVGGSNAFVARVPSQGTVQLMINTTNAAGGDSIAIDETNNRLYLAYNNYFTSSIVEDVKYVALNANDATPATLAGAAALQTALGVEPDVADIAVLPNGNLLYWSSFGASLAENTMLQITPAGAISTFAAGADIAAVGGASSLASSNIAVLSDGSVIFIQSASPEFIAKSADGTSWELVATEQIFLDDTDIADNADIDLQGNGLAVDSSDNVFFASQNDNAEGIIKMSGLNSTPQLGAGSWESYK